MALPAVPVDRVNKPSTSTPTGATFFNAVLAWMRAVTTGGAGSGLDADTWSGFNTGFGMFRGTIGNEASFNDKTLAGHYKITISGTRGAGAPLFYSYGVLLVIPGDVYVRQIMFNTTSSGMETRCSTDAGSNWSTWEQIWSPASDGNGGQPPQAKGVITSTSVNTATATTVYTFPAYNGYFTVVFKVDGSGASAYTASAGIMVSGDNTAKLAWVSNGTNLAITLSGMNIQVTQTAGFTTTVAGVVQKMTGA